MSEYESEDASPMMSLPRARGFRPEEIKDIGTLVHSIRKIAQQTPGLWIRNAQIEVVDVDFMEPFGMVTVTTDEAQNVEVTFQPNVNYYN